ncbi:MAG: magnesium transporter [Epsilonproteobacteria bacterium]|nr:magnesium transporter [Campylobacterota bacterium]NPA63471.1 magnesium transporter [Campylobacterota bacterium]
MRFEINPYLIDDIKNCAHPSDFEATDRYSVLILRLPFITQDRVEIISYAFLIADKIYKYNRDQEEFELLGDFDDLHHYLDRRIDKILAKISRLQTKIDQLEDRLYEDQIDKSFPKEWMTLKKELTLIERYMSHSLIAFGRFVKYHRSDLDELAFKDLHEHIDRSFRFAKAGIEKLDNLYSFYRAKMDEKTNYIMFVLTIISAIFLPLTLITGYFGMNTGGLPLTEDPQGTLKVTLGVLLFEIPFVFWIWKLMKNG